MKYLMIMLMLLVSCTVFADGKVIVNQSGLLSSPTNDTIVCQLFIGDMSCVAGYSAMSVMGYVHMAGYTTLIKTSSFVSCDGKIFLVLEVSK